MIGMLTRRRLFARSLAALLGWAGISGSPRPAQAVPACPHPLHLPLFAERSGPGLWFKTYLRLACPLCQETVHQRGYLPDTAYIACHAVPPPDWPVPPAVPGKVLNYAYDATPPADSAIRAATLYDAAGNITAFPKERRF
jgi:hypothetical protein